jgi:hypothetical protein
MMSKPTATPPDHQELDVRAVELLEDPSDIQLSHGADDVQPQPTGT